MDIRRTFKSGLHDLKYMGSNGENLADTLTETSHQQVPIDEYAVNLMRIAKRLKDTGADLIWCETTPVPAGSRGRIAGDGKRYNAAADKVMSEVSGITVNRLHEFTLANAEQRTADVHYTQAGSAKLAEQVASSIRAALSK